MFVRAAKWGNPRYDKLDDRVGIEPGLHQKKGVGRSLLVDKSEEEHIIHVIHSYEKIRFRLVDLVLLPCYRIVREAIKKMFFEDMSSLLLKKI